MINRILLTTLLLSLCFGLLVNDADAQDSIDQELSVFLASPGEDETFYIAPNGFLVSVPIAGQVISYGAPLRPDIIELTLELINEAGDVLQVTPPIDEFGHFEVWATITSPDAFLPITEIREGDLCSSCHQMGDVMMPAGVTQLVVHVDAGDGRSISTTRSMRLDQGVFRNLPVRVEGLPAEVTDAQIRATTVIYDWRPRTFFADVNDRQAVVSLEGLTYTNLTYDVSLIPVVIDETLYTTSTERVVIRGGDETVRTVTLVARPSQGSITGRVVDGLSDEGVSATLLAVNLMTGAAYTTMADSDGAFEIDDLPIAEHVLLTRAPNGFHLPQRFDLDDTPTVETVIHLVRADMTVLQGTAMLDGHPLPFAEMVVADYPAAHADPLSGSFELDVADVTGTVDVEIAAAGCYSVQLSTTERDLGEIALTLREDTQVIEHDGARLYVPAKSTITQDDEIYTLQSGVLWVMSTGISDNSAFQVRVDDFLLEGFNADFAIEKVVGGSPRLYVSQGEVLATRDTTTNSLHVMAGQTVTLASEQFHPVDLVPGSGSLLRAMAGSVATIEYAPSASEQRATIMSSIVVTIAQVLMLLAYVISFLGLPLIVLGIATVYIYQRWRSERRPSKTGG